MYLNTAKISEHYDVDKEYFLRRKRSGEFIKNVHYIEKDKVLRWNADEIARWWSGEIKQDEETNSILDRLLCG